MERNPDHAVDTVIVGLQKVYDEARELGLHEVAHLASTALLAAEEEAEKRIILRRIRGTGGSSEGRTKWTPAKERPGAQLSVV